MQTSYLNSSFYFDFESEEIQNMVAPMRDLQRNEQKIEQLYLKVRDGWRYNPYVILIEDQNYVSSKIFHKNYLSVHNTQFACSLKLLLLIFIALFKTYPAKLYMAGLGREIS